MKRKKTFKILLITVAIGAVVFGFSWDAQMREAGQLQAAGWNVCPGFLSSALGTALAHATVAALSTSALLIGLQRQSNQHTHIDPVA